MGASKLRHGGFLEVCRSAVCWIFLGLAFFAPLVAWIAWRWGRGHRDIQMVVFRVQGDSMAPTLVGIHDLADCCVCEMTWPIQRNSANHKESLVCFHCGETTRRIHDSSPDLVAMKAIDNGDQGSGDIKDLRRGDLVAVNWQGKQRLKRVAAVCGDSVDQVGLHLIVNGQRLEDLLAREDTLAVPLPWMPVDLDHRRRQTRWFSDQGWYRDEEGNWIASSSDWLTYHHRSIHHQNGASEIWDDYPYNVEVDRKLQSVDRLRLQMDVTNARQMTVEIAFWCSDGPRSISINPKGNQECEVSSLISERTDGVPVSPRRPVAVRVKQGQGTLSNLTLMRLIQYRIRPHDDATIYPLTMKAGELFVVGDNVPLSIDSRDVGKLKTDQVFGKVTRFISPGLPKKKLAEPREDRGH